MWGLFVFVAVIFATFANVETLPTKPNFVVLFADDLGYGDLSSFGHPTINTPNLDRMVAEGKKLTQWYSAWSMCTPSRAALLTGRIPLRSGMGSVLAPDSVGGIPENETLISELLQEHGYTTGILGKWHLGQREEFLPTQHGFNYYYGVPYSVDMGAEPGHPCPHSSCTNLPLLQNNSVLQQPVPLNGLEMSYASRAVTFIQENMKEPFFLYMAFSHAHVAVQGQWCSQPFYNTSVRGLYGDAVQELDWVAGQILNTLRDLELDKNTLVVFSSDNGPWLEQQLNGGSAGLFYMGKGSTWEGGIRMPGIAWWPGVIEPGTSTNELVSTMDIFTTILSLAGAEIPNDRIIDGLNITNTLLYGGPSPHDYMFFWNGRPGNYSLNAVRSGNYKLHFITLNLFNWSSYTIHNPPLLYDVNMDPGEHYPLNATIYSDLINEFQIAADAHKKQMIFAVDQLALGTNVSYAICCNPKTSCTCGQPHELPMDLNIEPMFVEELR